MPFYYDSFVNRLHMFTQVNTNPPYKCKSFEFAIVINLLYICVVHCALNIYTFYSFLEYERSNSPYHGK